MQDFAEIIRFVHQHSDFAITSHARPDGDSLGSELALAATLRSLGKNVRIVNCDPHPQSYVGLPDANLVNIERRLEGRHDAVFVLETTDLERTGVAGLENCVIINIDHHKGTLPYGTFNWVDGSASAVGEMVYELIRGLGVKITPEIATNLYVAILTDTGSFQFSNTTAKAFGVARELVEAGANPSEIAQMVYMSHPLSKLRLVARVLDTLEIHPSRKIAWILLTKQMLEETGASAVDTEGMVNYPLSIEGVCMVAFFREDRPKVYRISLRSKDNFDVASAAEFFGGGGHTNAAGLWAEGTFEEVKQKVIQQVERLLD